MLFEDVSGQSHSSQVRTRAAAESVMEISPGIQKLSFTCGVPE